MSVRLLAVVSVLIAVVGLFIRPIARMLGAPDIMDLVVEYLTTFGLGPTFMFSYAMCTWLRNTDRR